MSIYNLTKDISLVHLETGETHPARLEVKDLGHYECYVAIIYNGNTYAATESDFYSALNKARAQLEPLGLIPALAGACINLAMSGMAADMGRGWRGYIAELGVPASGKAMTEIFADKLIGPLGTVEEGNSFLRTWRRR